MSMHLLVSVHVVIVVFCKWPLVCALLEHLFISFVHGFSLRGAQVYMCTHCSELKN